MPVSVGYLGLVIKSHRHSNAVGDGGILTSETILSGTPVDNTTLEGDTVFNEFRRYSFYSTVTTG